MPAPKQRQRGLMTVLFTDIQGSTELAADLGDRDWRATLEAHDGLSLRIIEDHGGRRIRPMGDGALAVFDSPGQAVLCGLSIVAAAMSEASLPVRAGVHTGECELRADDIAGIAVHVAARVSAVATGGQVLVSRTVRDLVAGDDLAFSAAGTHAFKGVPGRWQVFEATHRAAEMRRQPKAASKAANRPATKAKGPVLTVGLVDDHPLWRQTLKSVVEEGGGARVVGEAADGADALALALSRKLDVLLMDMDLPTVHGIQATAAVAEGSPTTRVLVLSSSDDPSTVLAAVRAGASGYLLKTADATEIRSAIARVAAGELVFPPALTGVLRQGLSDVAASSSGPLLSPRETAVLDLMAEGLSNAAIGKALFLSGKTVEAHVGAIFTKLDIPPTDDVNRRVRAVVAHLSARAGQH